jgi:hypothetical protein
MALDRFDFGGTSSDFVYSVTTGGMLRVAAAHLTMWDAETGGTQITDLLFDDSPTFVITVLGDGQIPTFQGPVGVTQMWASAGGTRVLLVSSSGAAERAESAAADAEDARDVAVAAGTTTDLVMASRITTPGSAVNLALHADFVTAVISGDPSDPDVTLYQNGVEL